MAAWAILFTEELWELGTLLFSGDHTCLEEGAPQEESAHLAGRSQVGGRQICLFQWRGSTQEHICVQWFLLQSIHGQGHFTSVGLSNKGEGCTMLGRIHLLGLVQQLERGCLCIRFICFMYLLYLMLQTPLIYTSIPNWFSPGGFIQGHIDQKYLCSFHACLECRSTYLCC